MPVYHAVNPSRAAQRQHMRACLPCHKGKRFATVNRRQLATMRAGLFRIQSRRRRWRACSQLMQRGATWHDATTPQRIHAAPGVLCKFAQIRAVQSLQNRPISTTRNTLQELSAAISNGLVAFRSTPGSAAQGIPDRPPGVDALRLYAVGVEFL